MPVCVEGAKCAKYNMYMRWWNGTHMVITRHVMRPIYARVSRGVAPISTYCPYRARYLLNPRHGGNPGCRSPSVCFTLG